MPRDNVASTRYDHRAIEVAVEFGSATVRPMAVGLVAKHRVRQAYTISTKVFPARSQTEAEAPSRDQPVCSG